MATMTREQVLKFNKKCENGFVLDLQYFVIWGCKRCRKLVKFEGDQDVYEIIIDFIEKTENFKRKYRPVLEINRCVNCHKEMYTIHRIYEKELGDMIQRKTVKTLQEFTKEFTDKKVFELISCLV